MRAASSFLESLPDPAFQILKRLEASERPLITSHIRLDGDALGTELALAHVLRDLGAKPAIVNESPIPRIYRFLPGAEWVGTSAKDMRGDHDLFVVLDTPTWQRAQTIRNRLRPDIPVVSIDHHPPIERMSKTEWVDTGKSSVGEMVYLMARVAHWPISAQAATCLYAAILTDTGRFIFSNTTPSALRAAADLIELGADHVGVSENIYQQESPALMALRAEVIQSLRRHAGGKIALMVLTRETLQRTGLDPMDTQDIADLPRSLAGAVVGVLLREMKAPRKIKVSLRSRSGIDIEPVARQFGGGGHHEAAGCQLTGTLEGVEGAVVQELTRLLKAAGVLESPETKVPEREAP